MLESGVENSFTRKVVTNGDLCFKISIIGIAGFPDRIIFFKFGGFMWIELKRPGKEPRKLQYHRMHQLKRFNHAVYWADSTAKAIEYYKKEREKQKRMFSRIQTKKAS